MVSHCGINLLMINDGQPLLVCLLVTTLFPFDVMCPALSLNLKITLFALLLISTHTYIHTYSGYNFFSDT
jgi:hypothetical protein